MKDSSGVDALEKVSSLGVSTGELLFCFKTISELKFCIPEDSVVEVFEMVNNFILFKTVLILTSFSRDLEGELNDSLHSKSFGS